MEAIILAGGKGTRLRSVVPDLPKPMADIGGVPFLEILLRRLEKFGFSHVVLSLGYKAEVIISYIENNSYNMQISCEVEQNSLGTGGAARRALSKCTEDHVYILNGDTYLEFDVTDIETIWDAEKKPMILGYYAADTSRYGRLVIQDDLVMGFIEKGEVGSGFINGGCYVIPIRYLDDWPLDKAFSIENDHFPHSIEIEKMRFVELKGMFIDIGIPDDYFRAQELLKDL